MNDNASSTPAPVTETRPHDCVVVEIRDEGILVRPASNFLRLKGFLGKGLPREKERVRMAMGIAGHLRTGRHFPENGRPPAGVLDRQEKLEMDGRLR